MSSQLQVFHIWNTFKEKTNRGVPFHELQQGFTEFLPRKGIHKDG